MDSPSQGREAAKPTAVMPTAPGGGARGDTPARAAAGAPSFTAPILDRGCTMGGHGRRRHRKRRSCSPARRRHVPSSDAPRRCELPLPVLRRPTKDGTKCSDVPLPLHKIRHCERDINKMLSLKVPCCPGFPQTFPQSAPAPRCDAATLTPRSVPLRCDVLCGDLTGGCRQADKI